MPLAFDFGEQSPQARRGRCGAGVHRRELGEAPVQGRLVDGGWRGWPVRVAPPLDTLSACATGLDPDAGHDRSGRSVGVPEGDRRGLGGALTPEVPPLTAGAAIDRREDQGTRTQTLDQAARSGRGGLRPGGLAPHTPASKEKSPGGNRGSEERRERVAGRRLSRKLALSSLLRRF